MVFSKEQILEIYRHRASFYDFTANLYRLIGFREVFYRREAVKLLGLGHGDTVVEMCCGTGLNFPFLHDAVGGEGEIIGVDFSDPMLGVARKRIEKHGWENVKLVRSEALAFQFPTRVDGILSTFAITLVPEFDRVIKHAADALRAGGRLVILDLKQPPRWPQWLVRYFVWLTKPFGVTLGLTERHPWESVRRHLRQITYREYYFGCLFLSAGENRGNELADWRRTSLAFEPKIRQAVF